MSEIGVTGARGNDQVVVRNLQLRSFNQASFKIEARNLCHQNLNIFVAAENRTNGRGDLSGRKTRSRDLIEQGLERMVILAVDYDDLNRSTRQSARGIKPAKSGAHDHHTRCFLAVHPLPFSDSSLTP